MKLSLGLATFAAFAGSSLLALATHQALDPKAMDAREAQEHAEPHREIALTFDDAPRGATKRFDGPARAESLLRKLREAGVPRVAFFANSVRATGEGLNRLKTYAAAGHAIGNHTYDHPDFNVTPVETYLANIKRADAELSVLPGFIRLFRFPFLREGKDLASRDLARAALGKLGYRNAYITVDNYDWHMDALLQRGLNAGRHVNEEILRDVYVDVLMESAEFYDRMAQAVLGRSPRHVILLHENDLAASHVDALVARLRKDGWTIISPEEAYQDAIAQIETPHLFPHNPGRIGEIAKDRGYAGDLWPDSADEAYLEALFESRKVFQ